MRSMRSGHGIGLALSGGTLKATAHIGVLTALHELGIYPDCVAGTSAGSFIAALYAHGYTPKELVQMIRRFPGPSLFDYGFPFASSVFNSMWYRMKRRKGQQRLRVPAGLLRGDKLYKYFHQRLKGREVRLPYYIIATDLMTGAPVVFSNDPHMLQTGSADPIVDPARCVRGSCSLPGVFTPVRLGSRVLVDGAFRHYVPVEVLRQAGCEKIIAVNLYSLQKEWAPQSIVHVLARSYDILLQESVEADINGPNVIVIEPDVSHMSWISFEEMESGAAAGREAVLRNKDKILQVLQSDSTSQRVNWSAGDIIIRFQSSTKKPPDVRG